MKILNRLKVVAIFLAATFISSCVPDQEVAPISSPNDNPRVNIEPENVIPNTVTEGDTLWFKITSSAFFDQGIDFRPNITNESGADIDDILVLDENRLPRGNGYVTLQPWRESTLIGIVVKNDGIAETGETLNLNIDASDDIGYNWQLNPNSDSEAVSVKVNSFDYHLEWSEGGYQGENLCEWSTDLDTYIANSDFSIGNYDGATDACPMESVTFKDMPNGNYNIYVDFYNSEITESGIDIPWEVVFSNNNGEPYVISGSFKSQDIGTSVIVGTLVIQDGVYTLKNKEGEVLGTI